MGSDGGPARSDPAATETGSESIPRRGSSVREARAGVVARLRARRDELVREIFARVRAGALAGPGGEGAEYVEGLRAAVAAAVDFILEGIERGEDWDGQVPVVAVEQARRAARAGVPLNTVLRRYMAGHTLLERFVMDEADRGDERDGVPAAERESLRGALRAQAAALDRLLERIAQEYGDELERIGRSPEQRRAERVRGMLVGGAVAGDGAGLDYEIEDRWHLGAIAVGADASAAVRSLAGGVDRRLLSVAQGERTVWVWLGGRQPFEVGEVEQVVGRWSRPPQGGAVGMGSGPPDGVVLVLGEPGHGLEGWRLTHRQAQAALAVALRRPPGSGSGSGSGRGSGRGAVTRYVDVALLATALKDEQLGRALIDVYVTPLEDARGDGPVLRETLRAYLAAERNGSSAAAALGIARNTLESRLRTIEVRLGRTLHPCPAELEVALLLDELVSAPQPPEVPIAG
jgi:hypothetical protein